MGFGGHTWGIGMMTDDRIDGLIRRLDVPSTPDPKFVAASAAALRPRVRAARVADLTRLGRLRRDLGRMAPGRITWARPTVALLIVALIVLALLATAIAIV